MITNLKKKHQRNRPHDVVFKQNLCYHWSYEIKAHIQIKKQSET